MKELVIEVQFFIWYVGRVLTLRPNLSEEVIGPICWNFFRVFFLLDIRAVIEVENQQIFIVHFGLAGLRFH